MVTEIYVITLFQTTYTFKLSRPTSIEGHNNFEVADKLSVKRGRYFILICF